MKFFVTIICTISLLGSCGSQQNQNNYEDDLVTIYTIYKNTNAPNKDHAAIQQTLDGVKTSTLKASAQFINEWVKPKHDLLSERFIKKPDLETLRAIYLVREISWNSLTTGEFNPKDILHKTDVSIVSEQALLHCYYGFIFNKILTQFQSKNYANVDFNFDKLGLTTPEEKAIFYYSSLEAFGRKYVMQSRSKTDPCIRANNYLRMMPKFEGQNFAEYKLDSFTDFKLDIANNKRNTSFSKHSVANYNNAMSAYKKCND